MNIFIDDSGSFSWANPGISLFCGLTVPDRALAGLEERWSRWKRTVIGKKKHELKGSELTDQQLYSFSHKVLQLHDRQLWMTYVGADTRMTRQDIVARHRDQIADTLAECSKFVATRKNRRLAQQYLEMSGWTRNRSTDNVMWMFALGEAIQQSLQHSLFAFVEPGDDPEFEKIDIVIDQSFIRRDEHVTFWKELLRQRLRNAAKPIGILDTWKERDHPFIRKYERGGYLDLRPIFQDRMRFRESHQVVGLQVADVCAHIALRYFRGQEDLAAFRTLRRRIVGEGGRLITAVHIHPSVLFTDSPANHVKEFDMEEYKARAKANQAARLSSSANG